MAIETEVKYLPWEVTIEIFSRLPVKSLLRFRSVSKSCDSLLNEPLFKDKHLRHSLHHEQVIVSHRLRLHQHMVSFPLSSVFNRPIDDAVKIVHPMKGSGNCVRLSNCCNGLFCIEIIDLKDQRDRSKHYDRSMFLWNPSTRESRKIPNPPIEIPSRQSNFPREYWAGITHVLGFDSPHNDYKVLRVVNMNCLSYHGFGIEGEIYSRRSNCWRRIDKSHVYALSDSSPCRAKNSEVSWSELPYSSYMYLNGSVHWLGGEKTAPKVVLCTKIYYLDLSTETFGEIALPHGDDTIAKTPNALKGLETDIAVLSGMLCVFTNQDEKSFVLWAMRRYGDQESWEKLFDVPYNMFGYRPFTSFRAHKRLFVPLYMFGSGDKIFLEDHVEEKTPTDYVRIYDRNLCGLRKVCLRGHVRIELAHVYADTLISPNL